MAKRQAKLQEPVEKEKSVLVKLMYLLKQNCNHVQCAEIDKLIKELEK